MIISWRKGETSTASSQTPNKSTPESTALQKQTSSDYTNPTFSPRNSGSNLYQELQQSAITTSEPDNVYDYTTPLYEEGDRFFLNSHRH